MLAAEAWARFALEMVRSPALSHRWLDVDDTDDPEGEPWFETLLSSLATLEPPAGLMLVAQLIASRPDLLDLGRVRWLLYVTAALYAAPEAFMQATVAVASPEELALVAEPWPGLPESC